MRYRFEDIAINSIAKKKPTEADKDTYIGLEHLDPGTFVVSRYGAEAAPKGEKLIMKKGDVLFGKRRAYQKKVSIAPFDGIFSAHGMVLRPKEDVVDSAFFPFFISSDYFLDAAINISVGSLSPTINWGTLKNLEFELPSLDEQRRLAELLWAANATREAYKKLLTVTDELVSAQFIDMFGDPVVNSMNWNQKPLGDLGVLNRGVSKHRPRNAAKLLGGRYPLIQTGEIAASDLFISEFSSTYSEIGLQQSKMWPQGTLCITIAANIAKTAILTFDACFPDSIVGFISGDETNQLFIHFWFSFFQKMLEEQAPESAQKNINLQTLRELRVIVPPIESQNFFADFVSQSYKAKRELQQTLIELETTYKTLLQENLG